MVRDIAKRPGVWKRSGQIASIVGIDYVAAMALVPDGADRTKVSQLLQSYEAGLIEGSVKLAKREDARRAAEEGVKPERAGKGAADPED